ncbi:MAG: hypothetical protein WCE52_00495, partial [Candidatus Acidiferrum sp.]
MDLMSRCGKWGKVGMRRLAAIGLMALLGIPGVMGQSPEMQQKLAEVKKAAAENKQQLLQYEWTETTQVNLKG